MSNDIPEDEILIPLGPQHPALKEPINFMIRAEGEIVVDAQPRIGYVHRGIERLAMERTYLKTTYLVERVCGICSAAHQGTYCTTVEELLDMEIPPRGDYIRALVWELERLHSHALWLGVAGHEIGFDTLFMYTWRDRELVMDILEMLSGNRVNYGMNKIGGVRYDVTDEMKNKILKAMDLLEKRFKDYKKRLSEEPTVLGRLVNVGILDKSTAIKLSAVGPTLRASGVKEDIRKEDPYSIYEEIPFEAISYDSCDLVARVFVRIDEFLESINIIRWVLNNLPDGPVYKRTPIKIPQGEAVCRSEAPRGELMYYIKSDGKSNHPERVKIRTPTLANILSIREMLKGSYLADVPIIVAGIDPCISCMDRVMIVHEDTGKAEIWTDEKLREYSRKWYKKNLKWVVEERWKK